MKHLLTRYDMNVLKDLGFIIKETKHSLQIDAKSFTSKISYNDFQKNDEYLYDITDLLSLLPKTINGESYNLIIHNKVNLYSIDLIVAENCLFITNNSEFIDALFNLVIFLKKNDYI